jgi:quercetin dioxygenase-like cupin family protein
MALVFTNAELPVFDLAPGSRSRVLASAAMGATCMSVVERWLDPGAEVSTHRHPEGIEEAIWVVSGAAEFWIGDERAEVGPDCTVIVPPLSEHGFRSIGSEPLYVYSRYSAAVPLTVNDDGSEGEPEVPGT